MEIHPSPKQQLQIYVWIRCYLSIARYYHVYSHVCHKSNNVVGNIFSTNKIYILSNWTTIIDCREMNSSPRRHTHAHTPTCTCMHTGMWTCMCTGTCTCTGTNTYIHR